MSRAGIFESYFLYSWLVLILILALQFEDKYRTLSSRNYDSFSFSGETNLSNLSPISIIALFTYSGNEYSSYKLFMKLLNSVI